MANTREVLHLINRPGNVPSYLDAATWIDKAIGLVAPYAKRVCVRGNTDLALTATSTGGPRPSTSFWARTKLPALRTRAEALDPSAWKRLKRPAP